MSGKKLEVPIKKLFMGIPPDKAFSRDSLANPDSVDRFIELSKRVGRK